MTSSRRKREIAYVVKSSKLRHCLQECRLMSCDWKSPSHLPADELNFLTRQTFEFFNLRLELKKSLAYKLLIKQLVSTKARQLNLSVSILSQEIGSTSCHAFTVLNVEAVPRLLLLVKGWKAAGDAGKAKSRLKWIKRQIGFYFSDDLNFKFISDSPNLYVCAHYKLSSQAKDFCP